MAITVAPLEVAPSPGFAFYERSNEKGQKLTDKKKPVVYWGIYLDDETISYTSNREHAERTREWMEKWLKKKD